MIIYHLWPFTARLSIKWRMLKLCENGSNIDYLYKISSVLRKATETEISGLTFWQRFGSVQVSKNETEPKFGFRTSLNSSQQVGVKRPLRLMRDIFSNQSVNQSKTHLYSATNMSQEIRGAHFAETRQSVHVNYSQCQTPKFLKYT